MHETTGLPSVHGADTRRFARRYGTVDRVRRATVAVRRPTTWPTRPAVGDAPATSETGTWAVRFAFFAAHGAPSSSAAAATAWRHLQRRAYRAVGVNVPALLFGPFYFFAKGMWRKGATLLAATLAGDLALVAHLGDAVGSAADHDGLLLLLVAVLTPGGFIGPVASFAASYAYYLKVTRDSPSWNPFEGLFRRPR